MDSKKPSGRSKFKDAFDRTIGRRFRRFSVRRASQYRRSSLPGAEQDGKSRRDSILGPRTYEKPVRMTHSAAHSLFLPSVKRLGSVADDARDDEIDFDDYEEFGSSRCIGFKRMFGEVSNFACSTTAVLLYLWGAWMFLGMLFYARMNGWSYTASYYYSVQAGMSVGFGALAEEDDKSRLYTIFHVLIGSSFIIYVLSLVIESFMAEHKEWREALLEQGFRVKTKEIEEVTIKPLDESQRSEQGSPPGSPSSSVRSAGLRSTKRIKRSGVTLNLFDERATRRAGHGQANICMQAFEIVSENCRKFRKFLVRHVFVFIITVCFFVFLGIGVVYGMVKEEYSFIEATYFSVAALSTAGLQAPTVDPDKAEWDVFLLAVWFSVGIPFYGSVLFALSAYLVERNTKYQVRRDLRQGATEDEFHAAADLSKQFRKRDEKVLQDNLPTYEELEQTDTPEGKAKVIEKITTFKHHFEKRAHSLDWPGFLQMTLLRMHKVDAAFLSEVRERFDAMDEDGEGYISQFEFWASLKFDEYDTDSSGSLEKDEFVLLANTLGIVPVGTNKKETMVLLSAAFHSINRGHTGAITRQEFTRWIRRHAKGDVTSTTFMSTDNMKQSMVHSNVLHGGMLFDEAKHAQSKAKAVRKGVQICDGSEEALPLKQMWAARALELKAKADKEKEREGKEDRAQGDDTEKKARFSLGSLFESPRDDSQPEPTSREENTRRTDEGTLNPLQVQVEMSDLRAGSSGPSEQKSDVDGSNDQTVDCSESADKKSGNEGAQA